MSDKRTTLGPVEGASRRKSPPRTIVLPATDVSAPTPEREPQGAGPARDARPSGQPESAAENLAKNGANEQNWVATRQMFFAGLGGAVIVALMFFGVWLAGLVPVP